mgnify:CR=1 FL=1
MYRLISRLVIYRGMEEDGILLRLSDICQRFYSGDYDKDNLVTEIYEQIHSLLDLATRYGFNKNLWHNYLAFQLAMSENPFTMVSEKVGGNDGTVNAFAKADFQIFKKLFDYDFSPLEKALEINCFSVICNYEAVGKSEQIFNKSVSEKVQELSAAIEKADDEDALYRIVTNFYKKYGVGKFGLNKAFRVAGSEAEDILTPITNTGDMLLSDIIGYESQKQKLIENTEAFVSGRQANNVLLFGDAGTGKSTSIKAILNEYYSRGLRMIEVYKHEFQYLSQIIAEIKNRNYRFIIYMDDLSFEEFEIEYKFLKAVIEGGVETKPENILIYATSNRRHLIKESWNDRNDQDNSNDRHHSDTVEEKLSLVNRFGVTINYSKPTQKEYFDIVLHLARRAGVTLPDEELRAEANKWELSHGGISGRTAEQFVSYLASQPDAFK